MELKPARANSICSQQTKQTTPKIRLSAKRPLLPKRPLSFQQEEIQSRKEQRKSAAVVG